MGFFPDIYMARPSQVFSLNWLEQPIQNIFLKFKIGYMPPLIKNLVMYFDL